VISSVIVNIIVFSSRILRLSEDTISLLFGLTLNVILDFIEQWTSTRENSRGQPPVLTGTDEVLLCLLHLRHYPIDLFLAVIFDISQQTCYNTITRMRDWFYNLLKDELSLQTVEWRLKHSVQFYGLSYTYALDGSEQQVTSADAAWLNGQFYSPKKCKPTTNIL
jgi:hypothetical protein